MNVHVPLKWCFGFLWINTQSEITGSFFVSCYSLCFKACFSWYKYCYLIFFPLRFHFHEISFSSPLLSVCVCLLIWSESLVGHIRKGLIFLSIQPVGVLLNQREHNAFASSQLSWDQQRHSAGYYNILGHHPKVGVFNKSLLMSDTFCRMKYDSFIRRVL